MFKSLKKSKAQAAMQYASLIAIIAMVIIAMTAFIKRLLNARIRDASEYLHQTVEQAHQETNAIGNVQWQYEPYYTQSSAITNRVSQTTKNLFGAGTTGISRTTINDTVIVNSTSGLAPPGAAK